MTQHRRRAVRLILEPLEPRLAMDGGMPAFVASSWGGDASLDKHSDWARIQLRTTDLQGNPISSIAVGEDFKLEAWVQDLSPDGNTFGVFAAYLDVSYSKKRVSVDPELAMSGLVFGRSFENGQFSDTHTPGMIEAGAFSGLHRAGLGQRLLWSAEVRAEHGGRVDFRARPSTEQGKELLLYDKADPVPTEHIELDDVSIQITGAADAALYDDEDPPHEPVTGNPPVRPAIGVVDDPPTAITEPLADPVVKGDPPITSPESSSIQDWPAPQPQVVGGTGTVVFEPIEGGFFGISADDGHFYDPINLPAELRQNGLRVQFEASTCPDMFSSHMCGEIIEIQTIQGSFKDSVITPTPEYPVVVHTFYSSGAFDMDLAGSALSYQFARAFMPTARVLPDVVAFGLAAGSVSSNAEARPPATDAAIAAARQTPLGSFETDAAVMITVLVSGRTSTTALSVLTAASDTGIDPALLCLLGNSAAGGEDEFDFICSTTRLDAGE